MKKALLLVLFIFTSYIVLGLSFLDKHYFICPINYQNDFSIRSDSMGDGLFGTRRSGGRMHQGLDLLAKVGEPVLAVRAGLVVQAKNSKGMGNYIVLRHSSSLTTIYGHLFKFFVRKNQLVRQGDIIGLVGKTGNANYSNMLAHLHFEIRKYNIPQDPLQYLD
jgi:murein DD-endopeptidase MepM/ murein hydrolase activator NlpD